MAREQCQRCNDEGYVGDERGHFDQPCPDCDHTVSAALRNVHEFADLIGNHDEAHDLNAYVQVQDWLLIALRRAQQERAAR